MMRGRDEIGGNAILKVSESHVMYIYRDQPFSQPVQSIEVSIITNKLLSIAFCDYVRS